MKQSMFAVIVVLLTLLGCKSDDDVLATFKGGAITRGELISRLEVKKVPIRQFMKNRKLVTKELQMMGLDRIALLEAKKNGYDKSERFKTIFGDVESQYLGAYLLEKIIKDKGYSEKAVEVSHIVLKIYSDSQQELSRALAKAGEIIEKLDDGESFGKLARAYSEDITKKSGGRFGVILYEMFPKEYADAAFSLQKGKYTTEPVHLKERKRIFIIKADNIVVLEPDTIDELISDAKMQKNYRKIIYTKIQQKVLDELKGADDVVFNSNKVMSKNENDVIFSIGEKNYTVAVLNERLSAIQSIMKGVRMGITGKQRKKIIEGYFKTELLRREAIKREINKTEEYKEKIDEKFKRFLAGDYMEYVGVKDVVVKDSEVREEYNRNRDKLYVKYIMRGGKKVKIPKNFNESRPVIEDLLRKRRGFKAMFEWMKEKMKTYDFTIAESELEGK